MAKGKDECVKCGKKTNYSFVCNRIQVRLCPVCSDKWVEQRDAMISKAFKDYIK